MKAEEPPEDARAHGTGSGGVPAQAEGTTERRLKAQLHKQAQELAKARETADQESRYQAKFLASMSHQLRTPLNSIIGFSELLEHELFGPLNPRQKLYVRNVLQSGRQLLALINDVLELSRLDAGRLTVRREWVSAGSLIDAEERAAQPLAQQRKVRLSSAIDDDLPELYVDPGRIRQAIHHLLSNALMFTPSGGTVSIRALTAAGCLRIEIQDSGIGIAKDEQALLFRELIPSPDEDHHGAGLGLVLTRRLVEMHGGEVTVHSEPGAGSTFALSLPLLSQLGKGRTRIKTPGYRDLTRALVVDPEPADHRALEELLHRVGVSVTVATSAADAVRAASELRPGVVLLEVALPDADGWSVVSRLRSEPVLAALPILIVSAQDRPERSEQLGVSGYVDKPVAADLLLHMLSGFGIRICPIDGLRVLLIGTVRPYITELIENLHTAGCELQLADSLGEPGRRRPADLVIIDTTADSRLLIPATPEQVREQLGAVPIIWLIDQEGEPAMRLTGQADTSLALADALHLPHLVRSIYAAVKNSCVNADLQARSACP